MQAPYLLLGEIVRPQGIRGEVKVRHYTDDPARFEGLEAVFVREGEGYASLPILGSRVQKDDVFLTLDGVDNREAAEKLRGLKLYIDRANARPLGEDEAFIADILGATAYDTQGNALGVLKDVLTPGGVDVFVIDTPKGRLMMPALKTVLLTLDGVAGKLVLDENRLAEVALYEDGSPYTVPGDA